MQLTQRQIIALLIAVAVVAYLAAQAGAGSRAAVAPTPIVYAIPYNAPSYRPTMPTLPMGADRLQQERDQFVDQQRQQCAMLFPAPPGCP